MSLGATCLKNVGQLLNYPTCENQKSFSGQICELELFPWPVYRMIGHVWAGCWVSPYSEYKLPATDSSLGHTRSLTYLLWLNHNMSRKNEMGKISFSDSVSGQALLNLIFITQLKRIHQQVPKVLFCGVYGLCNFDGSLLAFILRS